MLEKPRHRWADDGRRHTDMFNAGQEVWQFVLVMLRDPDLRKLYITDAGDVCLQSGARQWPS